MAKHGKNYKGAAEKVDSTKLYTPKEAMELAKELSSAKFDETVEVAVRLGVDTRKADQNIRGSISLPHGTGKTVRVAVFAEGAKATEAEEAGADIVGSDDLVAQIATNTLNILLATMGVLVHGIRLNTLEFSNHKGISWSGSAYRPFAKPEAAA